MTVRKRGDKWYYDFANHKYRGVIPLARTKHEAVQAEIKIKREVFSGTYGASQIGNGSFSEFALNTYLPWARDNKRSWRTDDYMAHDLAARFAGKTFNEISPLMVEKLKHDLMRTPTKHGNARSAASVNMVQSILSRIFSLAIEMDRAVKNPCGKVKRLKLRNQQFRYLLPEEEPALLNAIANPPERRDGRSHLVRSATIQRRRAHLATMIPVAVGTGLRRGEQLTLRAKHCDLARRVVIATDTKNGEMREVNMSDDVFDILKRLCQGLRPDDYLWTNSRTGDRFKGVKTAFSGTCKDAGIEGLEWRHLRATFGTRLGAAGFSAYEIMALMGHSDIRVSQRYVRATEGRKREAVQATMLRKVVNA